MSVFNTPGPLDEWSAATSIAEHLTLRPSRFQVGCSRGAILTDPPKLRITLRCLLEVLRNETTARRGGPGSFDGVEEGCSGSKPAAEVSPDEVRRIEREGLEARLGRGGYVVGAMWDEGNMVHAMRRFGGTTLEWRFGDG